MIAHSKLPAPAKGLKTTIDAKTIAELTELEKQVPKAERNKWMKAVFGEVVKTADIYPNDVSSYRMFLKSYKPKETDASEPEQIH